MGSTSDEITGALQAIMGQLGTMTQTMATMQGRMDQLAHENAELRTELISTREQVARGMRVGGGASPEQQQSMYTPTNPAPPQFGGVHQVPHGDVVQTLAQVSQVMAMIPTALDQVARGHVSAKPKRSLTAKLTKGPPAFTNVESEYYSWQLRLEGFVTTEFERGREFLKWASEQEVAVDADELFHAMDSIDHEEAMQFDKELYGLRADLRPPLPGEAAFGRDSGD